jgi:Beta protein
MDYPLIHEIGFCLRVDDFDISDPGKLAADVVSLCNATGISSAKIDLVIDHRSIIGKSHSELRTSSIDAIRALTDEGRFRRIVLSGSNYPRDVSPFTKDAISYLARTEYALWKDVRNLARSMCMVRYGDYSVVHPDFVDLGPVPNKNAKIRYTFSDQWMIARGHQLAEPPKFLQYHELARKIVASPHYMGPDYSVGDEYIARCSSGSVGPGNLRTWVGVDIGHHVAFVSNQIVQHVIAQKLPLSIAT